MATTCTADFSLVVNSRMVSSGGFTSTSSAPDALTEAFAASFSSGTGDGMCDRHYHFSGTATAAAATIDLSGALTDKLGNTVSAVEVVGILIQNLGTAAAHILWLGAGSNPAFAGLFKATGDAIVIPAGSATGGIPFLWKAHYDGGGLTITGATADILTLDPGANTIAYRGIIWYRTA